MNKEKWVQEQVRNHASFKGFAIFYGVLLTTFLSMAYLMS